jgi:uncharacterized protein
MRSSEPACRAQPPTPPVPDTLTLSEQTRRVFWFAAGCLAVLLGFVGLFVPVMPTVPFLLFAAFGFSRSCRRCERWMLDHPRFGPHIRDWREHHAVALRVKQFTTSMMAISSAGAWWLLPSTWCWLPALGSAAVAWWLWRLPTRENLA